MNNSINRRDAIKRTGLLLGFAVSASTVAGVLKGCKADPDAVAGGLENWIPDFLSKQHGQLVAEIGECIIPKTDTPGAIETGVHSFIDIYLKDCVTEQNQNDFKESLSAFEQSCKNEKGKSFLQCNKDEKIELLKKEEELAIEKTKADPNATTFWFDLKELTFIGYFTSEAGSKQFLKYDPIPGNYDACIPLNEIGGTWNAV